MCYFNGVKVTKAEYIRLGQLERFIADFEKINVDLAQGPVYNQPFPVLKANADGNGFDIEMMEWGFLPNPKSWPFVVTREDAEKFRKGYKDEKGWHSGYTTLNATVEGLFVNDKGRESMYADAAMNRRCLALSTGFWDWRHVVQLGKKGQPLKEPAKYPYYVHLREKDKPFFMAAIYNPWTDKNTGEHVDTFSVVTTVANPLMAVVHNAKKRMPTILTEQLAHEWMFGDLDQKRITEIGSHQYDYKDMLAYPVDKNFKSAVDPRAEVIYPELEGILL